MSKRPPRTRRFLIRVGVPALLLIAVALAAALVLWESGHPLSALVIDSLLGPHDEPHAGTAEEPIRDAPPVPVQDTVEEVMEPATDLLANRAFIETGTTDGSRYVSLTDASGLWAISNPVRLLKTGPGAWRPGHGLELEQDTPDGEELPSGMPFAGRTLNLSLHEGLVRGRCVFVDLETRSPFTLRMVNKGIVETCEIEEGRNVVEATCVHDELSRDSLYMSMKPAHALPPEARPVVKGAWIVNKGVEPPGHAPSRPEPCGGSGVRVDPGRVLLFRALAGKGDRLEMACSGPGLSISVRSNPGGTRTLLEPPGGGTRHEWSLELDRQLPVEVRASLPQEAADPVCLEALTVHHVVPEPPLPGMEPPEVDGVVVILLDTLRADAAVAFNPRSPVETPVLARLAAESLVFEDATAHANYTKPSVGTILTGAYPHAHGALSHKGILSSETRMVTQMLDEAGVETLGLFSNRFLTERFGFMRGWDVDVHVNAYKACVKGDIVSDAAHAMLEGWEPEGPFFLYIHLMDPHAPYDPPGSLEVKYVGRRVLDGRFTPRSTSRFITDLRRGKVEPPDENELKILKGLYRGDVAYLDGVVGRILERLDETGILDRSLLIVTSDHGEEFMEHGWLGHGTNIHPELTHIPLLVRLPGGQPSGRIGGLVGHLDLVPTILDVLDAEGGNELWGRSLFEILSTPRNPGSPPAYLLEHWNGTSGMRLGQWMVLAHRNDTSIARLRGQKVWYQDPGRNPVKWLYLRERLALLTLLNAGERAVEGTAQLDQETTEQLEALGYILTGEDRIAQP